MVLNQMEHLIKIVKDLQPNATWFTTLYIYLQLTHPPIYLANYLPTYISIYLPISFSPTYLCIYLYFFTFIQLIYGRKYPWLAPLGITLPKSQESWTQFKKYNSIYLYIGLFDWIRWAMSSPPMHTLMINNEHPKTYNMH